MFKLLLGAGCAFVLAASSARAQQAPLIHAEQQFAVDLFAKLGAKPGNFVVSPYSILTELLMTGAGAEGETAAEIATALHVQGINVSDEQQISKKVSPSSPYGTYLQFHSASALWVSKDFPVDQNFRSLITHGFATALESSDFSNKQETTSKINNWIANDTGGKIRGLASPDMSAAKTGMVLTNSAYLDADWFEIFDPKYDTQHYFHVSPGHDELVRMMTQTSLFVLTQTSDAEIVTLNYQGPYTFGPPNGFLSNALSMVMILPKDDTDLPALEARLTADVLNKWLAAGQYAMVSLVLPRFQETSQFDMKDVLRALGVQQAFDPAQANFTGIGDLPGRHLYISDVLQKANVDMGDGGTSDGVHPGAFLGSFMNGPPLPIVPFVADHPFLYLVRENYTGAILFMGRVDDPTQD